ncbi:DUF4079 domain-containing protein [Roseofilum casamattae]|uniref:DUF4079 domain-containing protein n=1 Tax=Roseofilum casamattae BLCC-M143 TaxID=3022442 RepID=A0ABT7BUT0_9CYAN|nr:DUF4079 domain-containing protein [Roseofilum casamattae]MDJ1182943.1 DUF4079 domain-containing protein [Roseofilum casamattae BLCC-M143]
MGFEIPESVKVWSQFFHPLFMWILFGMTLYSAYLGLKIRQTRGASGDEKKELVKGKFNLKHQKVSSLILAFMILGSLGGMAVTYINNEKLFFGPHLLVGLAMMGAIATSASLTPWMQKGNDLARYTHITLNTVLVGLFGWQAVSGMEIVQKILDRM